MRKMVVLVKYFLLVAALLISLAGLGTTGAATGPQQAAPASAPIFHLAGNLMPGETVAPHYPLPGTQDKWVNLQFQVPEVAGDGQIDLDITDGSGGNAFSGSILDGETLWASLLLKPGYNTFTIHNPSSVTLNYEFWVYEIDAIPYDWQGVSSGTGTWHSHIRLNFPSSGLYDFDFEVEAGRYQFMVDNEYIVKTVEAAGSVSYYVAAGSHDLSILPDSQSATTEWELSISGPGAGSDSLPYSKVGGNLGGAGNDFDEEWLPLYLPEVAQANLELTLTGDPTETLDVLLYAGLLATPTYSITNVYGGETVWGNTDLPAGISRVQLVADDTNAGPLAYELTIHTKPTTPATWSGLSNGLGNNSLLRFEVDAAGLYDFDFGLSAGRYQFLVNSEPHIQKTVEAAGSVCYFLPAGTHELMIVQDPGQPATAWSLAIDAAGLDYDTLPYHKAGGNLGGAGNAFDTEWLPLEMAAGQTANFQLALTGDLGDGLVAALYQDGTAVYSSPLAYGGETLWWTADLAAGTNQVKLVAQGENAAPLQYDLTVLPVPAVVYEGPYTWGGVSKGDAGHSVIKVQLPVSATYGVTVDLPLGFANVFITETTRVNSLLPEQSHYEFDLPLDEGTYLFQVSQSPAYITTTWVVTVSLVEAAAPKVVSISPTSLVNDVAHMLTISGANFQPGAAVQIGSTALGPVTRLDSGTLQVELPAGFPAGRYSVTVTNPDGKTATLADALLVSPPYYRIYLPLVHKNPQ